MFFFTIFSPSSFIILLSAFVVVASFILAGITVSDGTHDVAVAALETAGNAVPKGGGTGATRRRFGHERSCVCKRINFFCEYGGKSTCLLGRRRRKDNRKMCVRVYWCV